MRTVRLLVAWLMVAIPLAWGVAQSVRKSVPLFRESAPAAPASPSVPIPNPLPNPR